MSDIRQHLRRLINQSTRTDPVVFVGRDAEREQVRDTSMHLPPDGDRSCTILIQGAPGCGKTSLISRLCADLRAEPGAEALALLGVPDDSVIETIYGHLASFIVGADTPTRTRTNQRNLRFGGSALGIVRSDASTTRAETSPTFRHSEDIASERRETWTPSQRAVVFVDEVQNVAPGSRAASMLVDLHTQDKIPVLLVCAGLSNSRLALADAGMSRIDNEIALGGLSPDEALNCARLTLLDVVKRGVRGTEAAVERWSDVIARSSDGWPQHLQVYLQASYQVLLNQDVPDFDGADLDGAIRSGDMKRASYYAARVSASHVPIEIVAALHERMSAERGISAFDARRLIGDTVDQLADRTKREWAIRFDDSTENCFAALLRAGVVARDPWDRCTSPIPSFSRYILEQ